ncbi:MAG: hypothetical protein JXA30_01970, partial [Deltaproteobacteria bacterium]|nr:hypothetical protein [Deltaproteobacteria bacterium]
SFLLVSACAISKKKEHRRNGDQDDSRVSDSSDGSIFNHAGERDGGEETNDGSETKAEQARALTRVASAVLTRR